MKPDESFVRDLEKKVRLPKLEAKPKFKPKGNGPRYFKKRLRQLRRYL